MIDEAVKTAFSKAKQDIFSLGEEISQVRQEILDIKTDISLISSFLEDIKLKQLEENTQFQHSNKPTNQQTDTPTHNSSNIPTHPQIYPTDKPTPTDTPTLPQEIEGLRTPNTGISTGNVGVPTDKQTDRQTNQQTHPSSTNSKPISLERAQELLESLDSLKKEVRFKFKRLTSQEMQVFSLLYNLEESGIIVDYKSLAEKLNLSESSIRDYIGKIQKKGIPITKEKVNNKRIILHISEDLKKIASLNTILQLREL
ncbi:MAG: HTH domain-containing protein [Nanoarchaeota archaeon]